MGQEEHFPSMKKFVLAVGNSRSGTSLVGAIIDAHPNMVCAHESRASQVHWAKYGRQKLLDEIFQMAASQRSMNRPSAGYEYGIDHEPKRPETIRTVGDKVHNPALLRLHGDPKLLPTMRDMVGVPLRLVHVIRNPLDVVTTMHLRSGAPIIDRMRWYFMHLDAGLSVRAAVGEDDWLDVHLERLISDSVEQISRLTGHLGEPVHEEYLARCRKRIFNAPKFTRDLSIWPSEAKQELRFRAKLYGWLAPYMDEIDELCS